MKNFYSIAGLFLLTGIILMHFASCEKYILPELVPAKDTLTLPCHAQQDIAIGVSSNVKWHLSVSSGSEWIEATPAAQVKGDTTIFLNVKANTDVESRQGKLVVTSETLEKSIVILQDGDI